MLQCYIKAAFFEVLTYGSVCTGILLFPSYNGDSSRGRIVFKWILKKQVLDGIQVTQGRVQWSLQCLKEN